MPDDQRRLLVGERHPAHDIGIDVLNPVQYLKKIAGFGNSSTRFLIEVPFFDFRLNHPLLFNYCTFELIMRMAGFDIDEFVDSPDLTLIAKKRKLV